MSGGCWRAEGGWYIEAIVLNTAACLRACRHGYLIKYCRTVDELAELLEPTGVGLEDLVEGDPAGE